MKTRREIAIEYATSIRRYIADEGPTADLIAVLAYLDAVISGATG